MCCNRVKQQCSSEVVQHGWRENGQIDAAKRGCIISFGLFPPFVRTRQQFDMEWGKVITLFSWVPAENVNLRLSYEKELPHLSQWCQRLRSGKSLATNLWCSAFPPRTEHFLPFLFLQGPSQSQAQFIQQRRARRGCGQLQRARRRDLLLISMQLHTAAFHTSPLTVTIIPTEDE